MNSALFLDRDGVINVDYGYVHAKDNFVFNEEIFDLVSFANSKNFLVIVVTNQAGIGKGLYTEEDFNILTKWISEKFISNNGKIEKTYFCPFHEDATLSLIHISEPTRPN